MTERNSVGSHTKRFTAVLLSLLVVASAGVGMVAASSTSNVSFDGDQAAPNPTIQVDNVTVSEYEMGWDSYVAYEANDGDTATLPASVNATDDADEPVHTNNPYTFVASDIDVEAYGEFPRKSDGYFSSALNAPTWTNETSGASASAGSSIAISNTTTAPNVEAVQVDASSVSAGDKLVAEYSNFSITSDADKRFIQLVADVSTLGSGATVTLQAQDADGDHVNVTVAEDGGTESWNVGTTTTTDGVVLQEQVGNLSVGGNGDGTMQEIQDLRVIVEDGDATVEFAGLNAEKTGEWDFGEKRVDSDDEDDLETEEIDDPDGTIHLSGLDTLGSAFDGATIHDLSYPADFAAADLAGENVDAYFNSTDSYPGFSTLAGYYYKLELPGAYDLGYAGAELEHESEWPSDRYVTFEYAEDVGDSTGIHDASYSDVSTPDSEGEFTQIDGTISADQNYVVHLEVKHTDDDVDAVQSTGAVGGPVGGSGDGGIIDMILSPFGALGALVGGLWARIRGVV